MKLNVFHNDELVADYEVDDQSTKVTQFDNVIYIGRSEECHVVIDDKQISRQHLKISKQQSEWEFEKVSEMGQILLNGSVVTKSKLKNGDVLQFSGYMVNVFLPPTVKDEVQNYQSAPAQPVQQVTNQQKPTSPVMQDMDDFSNVKSLSPQFDDFAESHEPMVEELTPPAQVQKKNPVKVAPPVQDFSSDAQTEVMTENESNDFLGEAQSEANHSNVDELVDDNDDFLGSNNHGSSSSEELPSNNDFNSDNDSNNGNSEDMSSHTTEAEYPVATGDQDSEEGSGEGTVVFSGFATYELHLFGEAAPYDRFIITDPETFIGRNKDKCKIFLDDQEVSGVHAVIKRTKISCTLEDLNSSNGTLVNGERINSIDLLNGDEFVIGGTTFTVQVKSDLLQQELGRLMPVEEDQEITSEEVVEEEVEFDPAANMDFTDGAATSAKSKSLFDLKDPAKRKKILYLAVGLAAAYLFLGDEEKPDPKKDPKAAQEKVASNNLLNKNATPTPDAKAPTKKVLDPEMEKQISYNYEKAKAHIGIGEYAQAIVELRRYYDMYPDYKQTQQLMDNAKKGVAQLAELDRKNREEEERKKRKKEVEALLEKVKEEVKLRNAQVAEALFGQILEKDPENLDVPQLKLELEAWKKEQERIALEKAQKEAERKRQLNLIQPGKTAYLKKDWNVAIGKLEDFLKNKDMDEDLIKEASAMLTESKNNLNDLVAPLLGQARSLKEGQDLKGAYQIYSEVLKKEPSNSEAITEMGDIRNVLDDRAKKIYREALISENLSLFDEAKEKFQEVQQNTPTDSDYYKKASEKLKNYVE
ncbi:MAG: FHA domain-containing protein [Bacteriovoracaceae bacterium]